MTSHKDIEVSELKTYLTGKIPEYMVPKHYVNLLTLPISRNGKVDRKKLLQMSMSYEIIVEELKHKPETKLEKKLAEVWKLLLNQEEVFIEDSYFELGGNSLIATKLSAAIRQTFNVKFMIEDVFDCVTFTEQAQRIEELLQLQDEDQLVKNTENQIIVMDKEGRYKPFPMTEIQKAYWIGRKGIYDLGEVSTHYYFEIENEGFNITKFNRALDAFLRSHDMMHAVTLEDGENQIVLEEVPPYALMQYDLENLSDEEANEKIKAIREELTHRVFKPEEWPLFDIRVTKLSEDRTRLHLCFDNIIFDGYSIFFFFNEVNRMYEENQYEVKEPVITFRDYILAVEKLKESAAFKEDKKYWMDRLYTLPPAPELTIQEAQQHTFKHLEHRMSKDKWEKLQKYLSLKGITPSVFLITAYGEILATWSRRQKFTLNLTRFNRMALHPSINEVVGDFTSLTLLEMDMQSGNNCTFLERCKAIQKQLLSDLQHPLFCGVQMQRELGKVQSSRQGVLMPVVFTSSLGLQINEAKSKNWFENRVFSSSETPQVWLDHQVTEENGTLVLIWDYVKEIFPKNMIDKMFKAYIRLLDTLAEEFNYFNEVDSHMVALPEIEKFEAENQLNRPLLKETLNRLVKRQLKATPDNIAVIHNDKSLTYGELNEAVNKVANAILKEEKKKLIGIFMEKGIEQVVAVLGIMCSGAGYLPLDPHHPAERINNLLKEAGVDMILTQSWMNKEQVTAKSWINVDEVMKEEYISDMHLFQEIEVKPEDTAYVIYTSGSTGKPKGVAISHESAVNTIIDINKRFNVGEKDRCIALSNLNFDLSVYDIFGLLSVGGAIVIPQQKELKNPAHWLELLKEHSVSVWNTVPTFMNMLTEYMGNQGSYEMLRLVMLSGDWIPMSLPEEVKVIFPNSKFISLGGATEASIWSNYYIVEEMKDEWRSIPYGKPLTNQTLLIYNDRMQPCPIGICGELYIGGLGVAQGYWYDEDRTNERFIIHPITKERVYKTGDLACYMEDGNIEFLGREDHQVKIRGFRIELGEIENAINQSEEVKESIVIVEKEQQQLIAFMTPANIENEYTHEALRLEGNKVIAHIKAEMIKKENKQKTARLMKEINQVSAYGAVNLLKTLNINESMDGIDKRYIALVEQWFKQLEKLNIDVKELKQFTLQNYQDLSQEAQDLVAYYKDTQTIYEAILKGERDVISLFLDENFAQSLSKLDFYNNINSYYYNVLIELLDRYCSVEKANQTVKVLELGTRFGSLLEHIQKANLNKSWDYTYSDESKYFLKNKEEQYKNINFKVFDMNKPVEGQDISGEKYDVILADNSLHRAKNIDVVLENVKQLLSPEGVLLFVENTTMNCFDLNVAGLYEYGFSQYEDDRKEKQMPFYNCASWTKKLEQNNMETIAIFGAEENLDEVYNRCLYVVKSKQNTKAIHLEALTKLITASLPDYMVPKRYVVLSKLPITPNGKIDRKRLMSYVANSEEANQKEVVKPINEMEEFILKLWQDILQLETISTEDNFFEIGGDSLLAIQCMNRLVKKYMVDISLQEIFTVSSIHSLAGIILEKLALTEDMDEGEI
ncbi:non-ribosomal peptide synthetase [Cellulosilyticum ruminicola]|uniref:non-ribosomal peptide synthetase n=1 Tax=Cellulosilyticum ruminicola TaxID=425254 RepID=UPI0006D0ED0D|nr:non-ribosomal peptide synthetase [Cellulosilyticum ruminicola]